MSVPADVLGPEVLKTLSLSAVQEAIVAELLAIVLRLPEGSARLQVHACPGELHRVDLEPSNPKSASVHVYLDVMSRSSLEEPGVIVCAGEDMGIELSDAKHEDTEIDVVEYFGHVIRAIIAGRLSERVLFHGNVLYKSVFALELPEQTVRLTRTNVQSWIRSIGQEKRERRIQYEPYYADDSNIAQE